jgi:hypothetical protein
MARKKLSLGLLLIAVFITFFLPAIDTDLGWHLRYGNYFLEHGRPMIKNQLTTLHHLQPWPNSYIIYHPLIALIHRWSGLWGLSLLNSIILILTVFVIWLFLNKNLPSTILVSLITFAGGWTILRYGLRGQIPSILFLVTLFYFLEIISNNRKKTIFIGLLFILWANFHGSYFYGILLSGLWAVINVNFWPVIPVVIAPLINPFFIDNYRYVISTMRSPLNTMIAEWTHPRLYLQIIAVGTFIFYLAIWWKKNKPISLKKLFWPLASLSALYLVVNARRNLPQFFLIQAISLAKLFKSPKVPYSFLNILSLTIVCLSSIIILPKTIKINSSWESYCSEGMTHYPCQAVEYIQSNNLQGNIYNFYRWGGFLTWQLPKNLIFVTGHIPANQLPSGQYPYQLHLDILQAKPGYQQQLDKYKIEYILIPPKTFLDLELQRNNQAPWEEIYRDGISVLYKRTN